MLHPPACRNILPQLIATLTASLNTISEGMLYAWTSPVMPQLLRDHQATKADELNFETTYLLCGLLSLLPTMYLVNRIGRRNTILLASAISLVAWALSAFGHTSIACIYLSRVLCGTMADVALVATPMYVSEIASQAHRGLLVGMLYFCELLGMLLMYAIGPFSRLYVPAGIGIALLALQLAIFPFMPQSPYYLASKGQIEEAEHALRRLRPNQASIEEELQRILLNSKDSSSLSIWSRFAEFVKVPSNRKAFFIVFTLVCIQQFSANSVIIMNLHVIVNQSGTLMGANTTGIVFCLLTVASALVCIVLVDKIGRRVLLVASCASTGVCLLSLAVYFQLKARNDQSVDWMPAAGVMVYAVVFKLGLGFLPQTIAAELYSNHVKAIGMTLADGTFILSGTLSVVLYETIGNAYGFCIPFYVFAAVAFVAIGFVVRFVPETKNKTFDEIQDLLKGIKSSKM